MTDKEAFDSIVEDGIAKGAGDYVDPEALNVAAVVLAKKIRGLLVEVVRCKKCKHFGGHGACYCHAADENGTPIFVREDDFCSYGERKDNGTI